MADFWELEDRLWLQGARAFEEMMDMRAVMVMPGTRGIYIDGNALEYVEKTGPWETVDKTDRIERQRDDMTVLTYRVLAHRADGVVYRAICSSVWERTSGGHRLVLHQQSPEPL